MSGFDNDEDGLIDHKVPRAACFPSRRERAPWIYWTLSVHPTRNLRDLPSTSSPLIKKTGDPSPGFQERIANRRTRPLR